MTIAAAWALAVTAGLVWADCSPRWHARMLRRSLERDLGRRR